MKINEIAVLNESKVNEAPVGMLKRAATKIASKVPGASGAKMADQVQSTANAVYKEFMAIAKNSTIGKPTEEGLLAFLKGKGFPVKDMAQLKQSMAAAQATAGQTQPGSLKDKMTKLGQKVGGMFGGDKGDQGGDDNVADISQGKQTNDPNAKIASGMYEAPVVGTDKEQKVIGNKEVEQIIMFAVKKSFENDQIANLAPGKFTPGYKDHVKQQQDAGNKSAGTGKLVQGQDGIYRFQ